MADERLPGIPSLLRERNQSAHGLAGANNFALAWSPDGRYIVFVGTGGIWWVRSDGAGKPEPSIQSRNQLLPYSFTPDGKRLAYYEVNPRTSPDIWTATIESDGAGLQAGKPESFLQTPADERYPSFSPDGYWLAYTSNESGTYQVYVRAFPDKGGKWQISNAGGMEPVWSGNGHELFFRTDDSRMMPVETPEAQQTQSLVIFLMNFSDELQRKVPAGK